MTSSRLILVLAALSLSACVNMQPVAPNTRPVILDTSYTRTCDNAFHGTVVFPKGVYQPAFQNEAGVYYAAPTLLIGPITAGVSPVSPSHGGLFIPYDTSAEQAYWLENTANSRFTFPEPIPYHH
jgi:hypothetical protein